MFGIAALRVTGCLSFARYLRCGGFGLLVCYVLLSLLWFDAKLGVCNFDGLCCFICGFVMNV